MQEKQKFIQWAIEIKQGDAQAYTALFDAMHKPLVRYAHSITGSESIAYDVLQDVFMQVWDKRATIKPDASFKTWLFVLVRNHALNVYKREKRLVRLEPQEQETKTVELHEQDTTLRQFLRQKMDELPERRREAFMLSRVQQLSYKEIATVMGVSEKTVNNHILFALRYLREELEKHDI